MNTFKCIPMESRRKFSKLSQNYSSSKGNIKDVNFHYLNCHNSKNKPASFIHDLNFMKCILSNNGGKLREENSSIHEKEYLNKNSTKDGGKLITIILNNTLCGNSSNIISNSDILICADGGANRLYNLCGEVDKKKMQNEKCNVHKEREMYGKRHEIDSQKERQKLTESQIQTHKNNSMEKVDMNMLVTNRKESCTGEALKENKNKNFKSAESYTYEEDLHVNKDKLFYIFNKLCKKDQKSLKFRQNVLPDLICGDFDSINEHVYDYYKSKSVLFEKCENQENTDLDKCIEKIRQHVNNNDKILILGATGNRFDQTCANISSLYKSVSLNSLYLIGENNFLFLLKEGNHIIHINFQIFEKFCAILPIGGKCKVKTEGLKYNLNYDCLSFDALISSSNEIISNEVKIFNDSPIIWYSQLKNAELCVQCSG
ncbi:thiamine pyrophosphokinase, putative [Plasmodium malariae]|uniref:Thiamine pyrophosphokinase, putative n=3 Tax=Plasmodium (Plasmodium) TaxID=418103 RepID=A0A1D3JMV9_PLAMA|nr:thiamine pyrophosphokinase, putative [Plasmodium malariae]SBT87896.1 thiamine pyrophosphokinase, putative [Plasmodium malariae]